MAITLKHSDLVGKRPDYLQWLRETRSDTIYFTDENGKETALPKIDHYPNLKEYEVWCEGYAATGERGGATFMGRTAARNFGQACHKIMCQRQLNHIDLENKAPLMAYVDSARWDYDPSAFAYWGCRLFWSEELAKASFG